MCHAGRRGRRLHATTRRFDYDRLSDATRVGQDRFGEGIHSLPGGRLGWVCDFPGRRMRCGGCDEAWHRDQRAGKAVVGFWLGCTETGAI